ncbi:MAG: hypothetical protein KF764_31730 [Labilithrix sp.]|nr:hypothetical protein [Labilithrix sp.]
MKEPKRLFEGGTSLERAVLGFGRDEAPGDDLARKTVAAMAAARAAEAAPSASIARWPRPRPAVVAVAAIGLGALVAIFVAARGDEARPAPSPPAHEAALEPAQPEVLPSSAGAKSDAVMTPDSLPNAPPSASPTPSAARSSARDHETAPTPAASASIAREVELLDSVKAKLGAGDGVAATRALDAYDGEFPHGALRPEATVLRIRALLMRGDRAGAKALGDDFVAKQPTGVHAKRIRALLADPSEAQGVTEK